MDKKTLRLSEPVLTPKQNPRPLGKSKKQRNKDVYQRLVMLDKLVSRSHSQKYKTMTDEQRKAMSLSNSVFIAKKMLKSPRFANERARTCRTGMSKIYGNIKTCTICHKERGLADFDKHKDSTRSKNVRRSYCRFCRRAMNKAAYLKRKERLNDSM